MSAHTPHPIVLEQVMFVRSTVVAIPSHDPTVEAPQVVPDNAITVSKAKDHAGRYNASMRTVVNANSDSAWPYFIDMECIAVLGADDTLTEEEAYRGVTITAHSVLYGAIREAVAWITSRQPFGPQMLGLSVLRPKQTANAAPAEQ